MRVMVLGIRGLPGVEGGVERHAERLYPLLVERGCEVEALVRGRYIADGVGEYWRGIRVRRLWSPGPKLPGFEAFVHSCIGVCYAVLKNPDILHIHSIGPAIFAPIARLCGLRVVVTYHTQDYAREKWGPVGRIVLRLGEFLAVQSSHVCIVISKVLRERVAARFHREPAVIPNGVELPEFIPPGSTLSRFGLEARRYLLMVSRMDPGKRHLDLVRAFERSGLNGWKLVLVGGIEPADSYVRHLAEIAQSTPGVILTGFQTGNALKELYSNAGIFVLPSAHEGLPVVLLEALSYGLPVIASNIQGNLEIGLPPWHYFPLGDVDALSKLLYKFSCSTSDERLRAEMHSFVVDKYDWTKIAEDIYRVYGSVL